LLVSANSGLSRYLFPSYRLNNLRDHIIAMELRHDIDAARTGVNAHAIFTKPAKADWQKSLADFFLLYPRISVKSVLSVYYSLRSYFTASIISATMS
jgi:hypothetical protein